MPACAHDVVCWGLCAACGQDVGASASTAPGVALDSFNSTPEQCTERLRPGLVTTCSDLRVSVGRLGEIEQLEREQRLSIRKLVLVLDIDHTLLVTDTHTSTPSQPRSNALGVRCETIVFYGQGSRCSYQVRLRPHLQKFLSEARELFDLYLYTQGTKNYAEAVVKLMDPDGSHFGTPPRLFHRDNTPIGLKNLEEIFPSGNVSHVVVVDDRDEVWPKEVRNTQLVKISPYLHFQDDDRVRVSLEGLIAALQPQESVDEALEVDVQHRRKKQRVGSDCDTRVPSEALGANEPHDGDAQLLALLRLLRRLHASVFSTPGIVQAVGAVLPKLRHQVLRGCSICFTGLPVDPSAGATSHPLAWWCSQLGASATAEVTPQTTHLVAARRDTRKYHDALQACSATARMFVVHVGWALSAIATWQRPVETYFAVPPTGSWPSFVDFWSALPDRRPEESFDTHASKDETASLDRETHLPDGSEFTLDDMDLESVEELAAEVPAAEPATVFAPCDVAVNDAASVKKRFLAEESLLAKPIARTSCVRNAMEEQLLEAFGDDFQYF